MLNKILLFLACFLGVTVIILGFLYNLQSGRIDSLETSNTSLQANNNFLIKKLEKEHNDKLEVSRTNELLRKQIKADKSGFDWHYNLESNPVLLEFKRLHNK